MSDIKNGGAAFPQGKGVGEVWVSEGGMTLRDYFAAKAMQGMYAADTNESIIPMSKKVSEAYAIADAMLKEREK